MLKKARAKEILARELAKVAANDLPEAKRSVVQRELLKKYPNVRSTAHIQAQLVEYDPAAHLKFTAMQAESAAIRAKKPAPHLLTVAMESAGRLPSSNVFVRGDPERRVRAVEPGEPFALGRAARAISRAAPGAISGRRSAFAKDHHGGIRTELPARRREVDRPAAALVADLKRRGLLDSTIVHWGAQMGRLPVNQAPLGAEGMKRVGRDHNTFGFSQWVAGGGFKRGIVFGETDEFSHHAVKDVVNPEDG